MNPINIFVLIDKDIPTDHSFIQGVVESKLPAQHCYVTFVGFGPSGLQENSKVKYRYIEIKYGSFFLRKLHKLVSITRTLWKVENLDVLYTRNDPVYLVIAGVLKLRKKKLTHIHQISHLHAYSTTLKSFTFRVKAFFDILFRKIFFSNVDLFFLISDEMKCFMTEKYRAYSHKFRVFPLGVNVDEFNDVIPWRERRHDLVYIGTLAKSRKIDVLIDAVKIYNNTFGKIKLHIWGASHDKADDIYLRHYATSIGEGDSVVFHGKVERASVVQLLKDSKIGLSTIPSGGLFKQISPTKLMEYLAAGCVVVASQGIPEQEIIMLESNGGYLIPFEPGAIAKAIHIALIDTEASIEKSVSGRKYILEKRSYAEMATQIRKGLDEIL